MRGLDNKELRDTASVIQSICDDLLGTGAIGPDDNFFEWGGDSMLLVAVHVRLEKLYPEQITLTNLFAYPTIAKLAALIDGTSALPLHLVPLPDDYAKSDYSQQSDEGLVMSIDGEAYERLKVLAAGYCVSIETVCIAVLAYLLSEASGARIVTIQAMVEKVNRMTPVTVDVGAADQMRLLYEEVSGALKAEREGALSYSVRQLEGYRPAKRGTELLPLIYGRDYWSASRALLQEVFDLAVELETGRRRLGIVWRYNDKRFDSGKMRDLADIYGRMMEHVSCEWKEGG